MTKNLIKKFMSDADAEKLTNASLDDMRNLIVAGARTRFANESKLTIAKAKRIITEETLKAQETIEEQVFALIGEPFDEEGATANEHSEAISNFLYGLGEMVDTRCDAALNAKSAKSNFSSELACGIVEEITRISREEIDAWWEESLIEMEREHREMKKHMKQYFKEMKAEHKKEQEESEIKAFGHVLNKEERAEKRKEFTEFTKATKARVKAAKIVREYSSKGVSEHDLFQFILRETAKAIHELCENPCCYLADVNKCKGREKMLKRTNQYIRWIDVA